MNLGPCDPRGNPYCRHPPPWHHCGDSACNQLVAIRHDPNVNPVDDYDNHKIGSYKICKVKHQDCTVCGTPFRAANPNTYEDNRYGEPISLVVCGRCKQDIGAKPLEPRKGFRYAPLYMYPIPLLSMALAYFVAIPMGGMEPNVGGVVAAALPGLWLLRQCKE